LLERKLKPPHVPEKKDFKQSDLNWEKVKNNGVKAVSAGEDPFHDW